MNGWKLTQQILSVAAIKPTENNYAIIIMIYLRISTKRVFSFVAQFIYTTRKLIYFVWQEVTTPSGILRNPVWRIY